jgi:hypothetical protein
MPGSLSSAELEDVLRTEVVAASTSLRRPGDSSVVDAR